MSQTESKNYFKALTGLRAIAAWSVYLYHFNPFPHGSILYNFVGRLSIGVDIFFVLSGFLITYRYQQSVKLSKSWVKQYFVNRIARIYPMFWILTTITFVYHYANQVSSSEYSFHEITKQNLFYYLMNISFLKSFFYDLRFTGIPQSWTLTVEECFYALAPLIFVYSKRFKIHFYPPVLILLGLFITFFLGGDSLYGFLKI